MRFLENVEMASYTEAGASLAARAFFWPSLAWNIARERLQEDWHWCDLITESVMLGAIPFQSMLTQEFQQLGVRAVVTLNEEFEVFISSEQYREAGIDHLHLPTVDFLFAPPLADLHRGADFIADHAERRELTYVHCKAGRGRSTTLVMCYLMKHYALPPGDALELVRGKRPQIRLAQGQWAAIEEFWVSCGGTLEPSDAAAAEAAAADGNIASAIEGAAAAAGAAAATAAAGNGDSKDAAADEDPGSPDGVVAGHTAVFGSARTSESNDVADVSQAAAHPAEADTEPSGDKAVQDEPSHPLDAAWQPAASAAAMRQPSTQDAATSEQLLCSRLNGLSEPAAPADIQYSAATLEAADVVGARLRELQLRGGGGSSDGDGAAFGGELFQLRPHSGSTPGSDSAAGEKSGGASSASGRMAAMGQELYRRLMFGSSGSSSERGTADSTLGDGSTASATDEAQPPAAAASGNGDGSPGSDAAVASGDTGSATFTAGGASRRKLTFAGDGYRSSDGDAADVGLPDSRNHPAGHATSSDNERTAVEHQPAQPAARQHSLLIGEDTCRPITADRQVLQPQPPVNEPSADSGAASATAPLQAGHFARRASASDLQRAASRSFSGRHLRGASGSTQASGEMDRASSMVLVSAPSTDLSDCLGCFQPGVQQRRSIERLRSNGSLAASACAAFCMQLPAHAQLSVAQRQASQQPLLQDLQQQQQRQQQQRLEQQQDEASAAADVPPPEYGRRPSSLMLGGSSATSMPSIIAAADFDESPGGDAADGGGGSSSDYDSGDAGCGSSYQDAAASGPPSGAVSCAAADEFVAEANALLEADDAPDASSAATSPVPVNCDAAVCSSPSGFGWPRWQAILPQSWVSP